MKLEVLPDADSAARRAAGHIAAAARAAAAARGRASIAVSGGRTPEQMLRRLADEDLPWPTLHFFQVDERVAPAGDPERNLTRLRASLSRAPLRAEQIHAMPVESLDLEAAAARYAATLREIAGTPPALDLIHLGLGSDGHTASLFPGDSALGVTDRDVALTGDHAGRRRMTLTYPALDRALEILWLVTGSEKARVLERLRAGDTSLPAGRVRREHARVFADSAAAPRGS